MSGDGADLIQKRRLRDLTRRPHLWPEECQQLQDLADRLGVQLRWWRQPLGGGERYEIAVQLVRSEVCEVGDEGRAA